MSLARNCKTAHSCFFFLHTLFHRIPASNNLCDSLLTNFCFLFSFVFFFKTFSLMAFITVISVEGSSAECKDTTAGPGSEICIPPYSFNNFGSTIGIVIVGAVTSVWSIFACFAILMAKCLKKECCTNHSELLANFFDTLCSLLSCAVFLCAAVQMTSSQPDVNQGDSVLEAMDPEDSYKMELGIAASFMNFVLFAGSLALNFKLVTAEKSTN